MTAMGEWKDRLAMPGAPERFLEGIRAGSEDIRRYEAKRRITWRYVGIAAALALLVGASAFAAARGMKPKQDHIFAALGSASASPEVHMTPDPTAAPTLEPQPAPGALLFGQGPYVADEMLLKMGLPETPEIEHAVYTATGAPFAPEEFAAMLWGDKWTRDEGGNWIVAAEDNPWGRFEMSGSDAPDGRCSVYSAFPGSAEQGLFDSRDAAYEALRAWLSSWLPEAPYLETLTALLPTYDVDRERVQSLYAAWGLELEPGVWAEDVYLTATYSTRGPESIEMKWLDFEPADEGPLPVLLTAAQAIDAFNEAYSSMKEEEYNGLWDPKQGYVTGVSAIYSNRFAMLGTENDYRFAWQIIFADAEKSDYRAAVVDGVTGAVCVGNQVVPSVYTPDNVAELIDGMPAEQGDYLDGEILYGEPGYQLGDEYAHGLPETPRLEHARYAREPGALDADTVAGWLWDGDYAKETYDFGVVYIHEAKKNVSGDFKVKAYVFDDDGRFHWTPDDPSRLYVGEFESREAALQWAEKWLRESIPDEYFAHPSHPGQYCFDGKPVSTTYPFRWDTQVEGVAVRGAGLSGEICTFGPNFFLLDLSRYLPVEAVDEGAEPIPDYLTAAQAVDALNWAAAQDFARQAESDMPGGDSVYGSYEDTIESVRPVFACGLFYRDQEYRLSWEITVRSAERGSTHAFIVDAESGQIWNDHDGAADTIYTR